MKKFPMKSLAKDQYEGTDFNLFGVQFNQFVIGSVSCGLPTSNDWLKSSEEIFIDFHVLVYK